VNVGNNRWATGRQTTQINGGLSDHPGSSGSQSDRVIRFSADRTSLRAVKNWSKLNTELFDEKSKFLAG
jgi:hypothetical protein